MIKQIHHILIALVFTLWSGYGIALAFTTLPEANREMFVQWGSAVGSICALIAGYYWGQSDKRNNGGGDDLDK
jgi:hypothetical protein